MKLVRFVWWGMFRTSKCTFIIIIYLKAGYQKIYKVVACLCFADDLD